MKDTGMRTYILFLLLPVVIIISYGCKIDEEISSRSDRFDFRQSFWGMNQERVKETESSSPTDEKPNIITYDGEFQGMPVIVGYLFEEDKLVRAGYLMTEKYDEPDLYLQDFFTLRDYYTNKFGRPSYDTMNWRSDVESNVKAGSYAQSACNGELRYLAGWGTHGSMVRLKLHGSDGKCELGVMYESKHYYVAPEMKKKEWDRYRSNMKRGGAVEQ